MTTTFQDLANLFPAILAPALVAHLRRRCPVIDGALVLFCVAVAGVAFSIVIGLAFAEPFSAAMVRRGVLLGVSAVAAHTMAKGKLAPQAAPVVPEPPTPPAIPDAGVTPLATARPVTVVESSEKWGPAPSGG